MVNSHRSFGNFKYVTPSTPVWFELILATCPTWCLSAFLLCCLDSFHQPWSGCSLIPRLLAGAWEWGCWINSLGDHMIGGTCIHMHSNEVFFLWQHFTCVDLDPERSWKASFPGFCPHSQALCRSLGMRLEWVCIHTMYYIVISNVQCMLISKFTQTFPKLST